MKQIRFWLTLLCLQAVLIPFLLLPADAGGVSSLDMLVNMEWQWETSRYNNDKEESPENPEQYSIIFADEGSFSGKADCNRIRGSYTLSGSRINTGPVMSTRAMCPPGSLDHVFLKDLERGVTVFFKGDRLYIDLAHHAGTMQFRPASGETDEKPPVRGASVCRDPRPQICTMQYDPVCGIKADNTRQTYSNGCHACADPDVIRHSPGECP